MLIVLGLTMPGRKQRKRGGANTPNVTIVISWDGMGVYSWEEEIQLGINIRHCTY